MKATPTECNQRGASAILVAASLLLLFGMAALAIDIGALKDERGFDQHGSDSSALGGALEMGLTGSFQATLTETLRMVDANIGAVGQADWLSCTDTDALSLTAASLGLSPATDCVSFLGFSQVRVKLPDQVVGVAFAPVLGVNELSTTAAAVARVQAFPGIGNAAPFVALSGSGAGDLICLSTTSAPQSEGAQMPLLMTGNGPGVPATLGTAPDPCDDTEFDPASAFAGTLNPLTYFDPVTGDLLCNRGLVAINIANGIDHGLATFDPNFVVGSPPPNPAVEGACNPTPVGGVNTMRLGTGPSASELRCGLLSTFSGNCADRVPGPPSAAASTSTPRLKQGEFASSGVRFVGEEMDDKALWEFLANPTSSWPDECTDLYAGRSNPAWDYFDMKEAMLACMSSWSNGDGQLFSEDITKTPRFAWIPLLAESNLNTDPSACTTTATSQCVHFNDFVPIYLQTLYSVFNGGQNRGSCDPGGTQARWGRHDAGQGTDCGRNNDSVDRFASIVIACAMLPENICVASPGAGPGGQPVPRIELLR